MILLLQHSDEEQTHLIKKGRRFSYKKKRHTAYDCLRKGKIAAFSESVGEDNDNQEKE